jgi:hypothetical protein
MADQKDRGANGCAGSFGQGYFEGLGYSVPMHANPADIFMDIVAGVAARSKQPAAGSAHVQGTMSPPRALFAQYAAEVRSIIRNLPVLNEHCFTQNEDGKRFERALLHSE